MSKETDKKRELAELLYMSGENQQNIADKVGVSRVTVNKWINAHGWKERRAAKSVTRPELINKLLLNIDKLLEKAYKSEDADDISSLGDKLAKLASTIEKLDKKTSVVDVIEVCIAMEKWLEHRMGMDKSLTTELVKEFNRYHDMYINEMLASKK
jgi:transposase-like protein